MKITEYADVINAQIKIIYHHNQNTRWSASFEHCETKYSTGSATLTSSYGNGHTPQEAIQDYVDSIRGKILVFSAMTDKRRELVFPDSVEA